VKRRAFWTAVIAGGILLGCAALVLQQNEEEARMQTLSPAAARLMATARDIVAVGPAAQGQPSKREVEALILERLGRGDAWVRRLPFEVRLESMDTSWKLVNLMASFRKEAKHRVLIGAHWDIRPWADEDPDPAKRALPFEGANDGVSGVAVLLEISRALSQDPPPEGVGVDLVFFDGEEGPKHHLGDHFLGSKELAERWFTTGVSVPTAGVIVDMVGRRGTKIPREPTSQQGAPEVVDAIFQLARERGATAFVDRTGPQILDDHIAFLARGVPVALLIDIEDPNWHTHEDTLDKLDPEVMAQVADVVLAWIRRQQP